MCGIIGFLNTSGLQDDAEQTLRRMSHKLQHRGPDSDGIWLDQAAGIAIAHQRLAIIDLSSEGAQPMHSSSGRYVISYNGEVYNYRELRKILEDRGQKFRGTSDTEIMLAAVEEFGIVDAVKKMNGMFAFALWDRKLSELTLVRDRIGIKPLYYGWAGQTFVFGSQLNALKAHPSFAAEIDRTLVPTMISLNYIPSPRSIYKNIYKLEPGCTLTFSSKSIASLKGSFSPAANDSTSSFHPVRYWSIEEIAKKQSQSKISLSLSDATDELTKLLTDAVKLQMVSDVPLGAFLSGGIDSSLVVALAQSTSKSAINTFAIGFHEPGYNEATYAKSIAKYLGCNHTELYLSANEAASFVPDIASYYDEPFADSSQIPTFLVSKLARKNVTVTLSGDGGDELFGGYSRYSEAMQLWDKLSLFPAQLRMLSAKLIQTFPLSQSKALYDCIVKPGKNFQAYKNPFYLLYQGALSLNTASFAELYELYLSSWYDRRKLFAGDYDQSTILRSHSAWQSTNSRISSMMLLDSLTYLPDDVLTKVDRASMAVSLESRVPLLDHRVIEYAWSLPDDYKFSAGKGKLILKNVLRKFLPQELFERPKMGFGVPVGNWLRGPLRDWAETMLSEKSLNETQLFNASHVRKQWQNHLNNHEHAQNFLWNVIMFQAWYQQQSK